MPDKKYWIWIGYGIALIIVLIIGILLNIWLIRIICNA